MNRNSTLTDMSPVAEGLLRIHKIISRGLSISIRKCDEYLVKQGIPSGEALPEGNAGAVPGKIKSFHKPDLNYEL